MNILVNSIKRVSGETPGSLDDIEKKGWRYCGIRLELRSFEFHSAKDSINNAFGIEDLRIIFADYNSFRENKSCQNEKPYIAGTMRETSYQDSDQKISFYIYCGGLTKDLPHSLLDVEARDRPQAEKNVKIYWEEVARNFIFPPTRVYEHIPEYDSCFHEGTLWNFCFIYLNDKTMNGIVLSGECSFD